MKCTSLLVGLLLLLGAGHAKADSTVGGDFQLGFGTTAIKGTASPVGSRAIMDDGYAQSFHGEVSIPLRSSKCIFLSIGGFYFAENEDFTTSVYDPITDQATDQDFRRNTYAYSSYLGLRSRHSIIVSESPRISVGLQGIAAIGFLAQKNSVVHLGERGQNTEVQARAGSSPSGIFAAGPFARIGPVILTIEGYYSGGSGDNAAFVAIDGGRFMVGLSSE